MENTILKHLLRYDFWLANTSVLSASLFSDTHRELYEIIAATHKKHEADLSADDVLALWKIRYPVATQSEIEEVTAITGQISNADNSDDGVVSEIITGLWQREVGTKIANLGISIAEGKNVFDKLSKYVEDAREGFLPTDFKEEVTTDIHELLELTSNERRFKFNIRALHDRVYGVGAADFAIVYARPETGKTAFGVSLAAGEGGFLSQGARVFIGGNEEDPRRTMLRVIQAYTGMTRDAIAANPERAMHIFNEVRDRVHIMDIHGWTISEVAGYIEKVKPQIAIIDQFDKVALNDKFDSGHERLRELYIQGRAIAKEYETALIAVCQASADAEGRTVLTPDMMEGSKTGKYAEGDLIIGIGKHPDSPNGDSDPIRYLTVNKNKLNGFHGTITCKIEPEISRYVD